MHHRQRLSRLGLFLVIVVNLAGGAGCRQKQERTGPLLPAPVDAAELPPAPVYALLSEGQGEPDALTRKLCDALFDLPSRRRADCCHKAPAREPSCLVLLGSAVRAQAVTLKAEEVDACSAAMEKQFEGCDWVGPNHPAIAEACIRIVHGTLSRRTRCRSSLECRAGLFCDGAGHEKIGLCSLPRDHGSPCDNASDNRGDDLSLLLHQDLETLVNGQCLGHCERGVCTSALSPGTPCSTTEQCDSTHHCAKQRCQPGRFARLGEECTGECESGLRCLLKKCVMPAAEGVACDADAECRGACLKKPAGGQGVCGKSCDKG